MCSQKNGPIYSVLFIPERSLAGQTNHSVDTDDGVNKKRTMSAQPMFLSFCARGSLTNNMLAWWKNMEFTLHRSCNLIELM